jgi:hypothetical protein
MNQQWSHVLNKALRMGRARHGVVGVDYGFVYKSGVRLKKLGIRFHVSAKLPLNALPPEQVLPEELGDHRCDVVEARYALQGNPRAQCDPLQPGVSIGNVPHVKTGTLGMVVKDKLRGSLGLLSNWHVLCGSPQARAGDSISQPGLDFAGTEPARVVATLERWVGLDAGCDAALALLNSGIGVSDSLFENSLTILGVEMPNNGMKVVKYGARSQFTHGMVDGNGGAYEVDYSSYGDQKRWIDGIRIVIDPDEPENEISLAGDSGAVWVNPINGKAVALHFGGEDGLGPTAEFALAQPLPRVLALLDVSFP